MKFIKKYGTAEGFYKDLDSDVKPSAAYIGGYMVATIGESDDEYEFHGADGRESEQVSSDFDMQLWWKIEGNTLYIRSGKKAGYQKRIMYSSAKKSMNGWYNPSEDKTTTKVVIENKMHPISLYRFMHRMAAVASVDGMENLYMDKAVSVYAAFCRCYALTELDLSNWSQAAATDYTGLFENCQAITTITGIDAIDTSNAASLSYMFNKCYALTELSLSGWDVSKTGNFSTMLQYCKKLQSVGDLSNWDVSSATDMSYMFFYCSSLASVGDLSTWDVSGVTNMCCMFYCCSSLATLGDISQWDVSKVKNMNAMFSGYTGYATKFAVDISKWDMSSIEKGGSNTMFQYNTGLTDISIPPTLKYVGSFMYNHCTNVVNETITIPAGVEWIGYSHQFYDLFPFGQRSTRTEFKRYRVEAGNTHFFADQYGVLYEGTAGSPTRLVSIPSFAEVGEDGTYEILEGVSVLNELMLNRCQTIKRLVLPDSFVVDYSADCMKKYDDVCNNAGVTDSTYGTTQSNLCAALYHWTALEQLGVKSTNKNYSEINGVLYSYDKKRLVKVPDNYKGALTVPSGCESFDRNCFGDWFYQYGFGNYTESPYVHVQITTISIPATVSSIQDITIAVLNYMLQKVHDGNQFISSDFDISIDSGNASYEVQTNDDGLKTIVKKA